uniref:Uncharacterized protein n=1 Tax=Phenylobacterium glaciei TaxID=2803784 RepID=A0A974P5K9_9CAUL|nr:hypothetical protein JKL49_05895 [Phenylobacterium glaciei]
MLPEPRPPSPSRRSCARSISRWRPWTAPADRGRARRRAGPKAEPARKSGLGRGRIKRSLEDMILAALRAHDEGADTGSILESLERRWNRSFQESRVVDELRRLSAANTVVLERGHWRLKVQPDAWTGRPPPITSRPSTRVLTPP